MLLFRHPRIEVIVAAARCSAPTCGDRLDPISLIGQFKVDYAIIGASAIDEEGRCWTSIIAEVQAAQPSSPMRAA